MSRLLIVDYGMGNLTSVTNAFAELGMDCEISADPARLRAATGIVLPGVGAFPSAMKNLRDRNLIEVLTEQVVDRGTPFLGICLGLQLLATDSSEQGSTDGLGWVEGHVVRIEPQDHHPVPHVGWNEVQIRSQSCLFDNVVDSAHFYFDHSYHLQCSSRWITATCEYGGRWVAAIQKNNIHAVQFHPEKSQRNGLRLLRNFLRYMNEC